MYSMKTPFDVKRNEIHKVVHPDFLPLYCRRFRLPLSFELTGWMYVLLVENLPISDSVLNENYEVRTDVPFSLRAILRTKLRPEDYQGGSARYKFKEPELTKSVYENIPPLSASVVEYEREKKEVPKFDLDEVLATPELGGITPVNIDPASMLADDIEEFGKEGKEFLKNPTLAGAASMAVIAIPGKFADKVIPDDALKLVTNHPNAHSLARHGGNVTDEQLMTRALRGQAPDGTIKEVKGKVILPPMSSAFHSNDLLLYADQEIRKKGGVLEKKIKESNSNIVTVKPNDMDSFELDLGRGFKRIGKAKYQPDLQGPIEMVNGLDKVQATYELNKSNGVWETITIFPSK